MENRFIIKNVVRRVNTRTKRVAAPTRARFKQYVAGRRLLRKQSISITEEEFAKEETSILARVKAGILEVITPGGGVINALTDFSQEAPPKAVKVVEEVKAEEKVEAGWQEPVIPQDELEEVTKEAPAEEAKSDDLTALPHIGPGRANKLISEGITSYETVVDAGADILMEILGGTFSKEMAEAAVQKAKEQVG